MDSVVFNKVCESYKIKFTCDGKETWEDFVALSDVTFTVKRGESFCIIGENGAGKTTTLKLIYQMLSPDSGKVIVEGKVSALLDLGAGFNPELTGSENIKVTAALYGLSDKEIADITDEIEEFSGLGKFIHAPVKTYSQGMFVRLGFSMAIHIHSDIILIDDIFAVGDESFQKKCLDKLIEFKQEGKTIIFASHDIAKIREFCDRGILLRDGKIVSEGTAEKIISYYLSTLGNKEGIKVISKDDIGVIFNNGKILITHKGLPVTKHMGLYYSFNQGAMWRFSGECRWKIKGHSETSLVLEGNFSDVKGNIIFAISIADNRINVNLQTVKMPLDNTSSQYINLLLDEDYHSYRYWRGEYDFPNKFVYEKEWEHVSAGEYIGDTIGVDSASSSTLPYMAVSPVSVDKGEFLVQNSGSDLRCRVIQYNLAKFEDLSNSKDVDFSFTLDFFKKENKNDFDAFFAKKLSDKFIAFGEFKLFYTLNGAKLFLKGREITKDSGFNTVFTCDGKEYHSAQEVWSVVKSNDQLIMTCVDKDIPFVQKWIFYFDKDGNLNWDVEISDNGKQDVKCQKKALILSDYYTDVLADDIRAVFPEYYNWGEVLTQENVSFCGVAPVEIVKEENALPGLIVSGHELRNRVVVQNSDEKIRGRVLQFFSLENHSSSTLQIAFKNETEYKDIVSAKILKLKRQREIEQGGIKLCMGEDAVDIFCADKKITHHGGISIAFMIDGRWTDTRGRKWTFLKVEDNLLKVKQKISMLEVEVEFSFSEKNAIMMDVSVLALEDINLEEMRAGIIVGSDYNKYFDGENIKEFSNRFFWNDIDCGHGRILVLSDEKNAVEIDGSGMGLIQNTGEEVGGRIVAKKYTESGTLLKGDVYKHSNSLILREKEEAQAQIETVRKEADFKKLLIYKDLSLKVEDGSICVGFKGQFVGIKKGIYAAVYSKNTWHDSQSGKWEIKSKTDNTFCVSQMFLNTDIVIDIQIVLKDDNTILVSVVDITGSDIGEIRFGVILPKEYKDYYIGTRKHSFKHTFSWEDIDGGYNNVMAVSKDNPLIAISGVGRALIQNTDESIASRIFTRRIADLGSVSDAFIDLKFMEPAAVENYFESHKEREAVVSDEDFMQISFDGGDIRLFSMGQELTSSGGLNLSFMVGGKWFDTYKESWDVVKKQDNNIIIRQKRKDIGVTLNLNIFLKSKGSAAVSLAIEALRDIVIDKIKLALVLTDSYLSYYKNGQEVSFGESGSWEDIFCGKKRVALLGDTSPLIEFEGFGDSLIQKTGEGQSGKILVRETKEALDLKASAEQEFLAFVNLIPAEQIGQTLLLWEQEEESKRELECGDLRITESEGSIKLFYKEQEITRHGGVHTAIKIKGKWFDTQRQGWSLKERTENTMILNQCFEELKLNNVLSITVVDQEEIVFKNELEGSESHYIEEIRCGVVLDSDYEKYFFKNELVKFNEIFRWHDIDCGQEKLICYSSNLPCVELEGEGQGLIQNTAKDIRGRIMLKHFKDGIEIKPEQKYTFEVGVKLLSSDFVLDYVDLVQKSKQKKHFVSLNNLSVRESLGSIKIYFEGNEITKSGGINTAVLVGDRWFDTQKSEWTVTKNTGQEIILSQEWNDIALINTLTISLKENNKIDFENNFVAKKDVHIQEIRTAVVLSGQYAQYINGNTLSDFSSVFRWEDIWCDSDSMTAVSKNLPCVEFLGEGKSLIQNTGPKIEGRILLKCIHQGLTLTSGDTYLLQNGMRLFSYTDLKKEMADTIKIRQQRFFLEKGDLKVYAVEGSIKIYHRGEEITKHGGLNTAVRIDGKWFDSKKSIWSVDSNDGKEMVLKQRWEELELENLIHVGFVSDDILKLTNKLVSSSAIQIDEIRNVLVVSEKYSQFFENNTFNDFSSVFRWEDIFCQNDVVCVSRDLPVLSLKGAGEGLLQNTDESLSSRILIKKLEKNISVDPQEGYVYESLVAFTPYDSFCRQAETEKKVRESKRLIERDDIVVRESHGSIRIYHQGAELTKSGGLNTAIKVDGKWFNTQSSTWDVLPSEKNEMILQQRWDDIDVTNSFSLKFSDDTTLSFKNEFTTSANIEIEEIRTAVVCNDRYTKYLKDIKIHEFSPVFRWEDILCGNERMALIADNMPVVELMGKGKGLIQNTDQSVKGRIMIIRRTDKTALTPKESFIYEGEIALLKETDILKYIEDIYTLKNKERVVKSGDILIRENNGSIRIYHREKEITKQAGLHIAVKISGRWFDTKGLRWEVMKNKGNEIVLKQKWEEHSLTDTLAISVTKNNEIVFKNEIAGTKKTSIDEVRVALVLNSNYDRYLRGNKVLYFNSVHKWEDIECHEKRIMCLEENAGGVELFGKGDGLIQNTGEEIKGRILLKRIAQNISVNFIKKHSYKGTISFSSYKDVMKKVEQDFVRRSNERTINNSNLAVRENRGNIKIYLNEREITSNSGLNNVVDVGNKRYESHNAETVFKKITASKATVSHIWKDIGFSLVWDLSVAQKDLIEIKLTVLVKEEITVDELKVSLLLNDIYKSWILGAEKDLFPTVFKWQDIAFGDDAMAVLGADISGLVFSGNGKSIIQNTGDDVKGRLLVKRCLEKKVFVAGTHSVFLGSLKLETDKFLNDLWEQKRKKDNLKKIISHKALSIKASSQAVDIYNRNEVLTSAAGLNISFVYQGRLYNAVEAKMSVIKQTGSSMAVVYFWDEAKLKLESNINILDSGVISWKINWVNLANDLKFEELRAGVFVGGRYNKWICETQFGDFPESLSWSDIEPVGDNLAQAVLYDSQTGQTLSLRDKEGVSSLLLQNTDKKPKTHFVGRVFKGQAEAINIEIDTADNMGLVNSWQNLIQQKHSENNYISSIDYNISVCGNFLKIFHQDHSFSESIGLHSAVLCGDKWYSSQNADWNVSRLSPTKMNIVCTWHHIPLVQEWVIDFIDNHILEWEVFHKPQEGCVIDEIKTGLIVSNKYKQWFNAFETGHFKDDGKWANMEIQHLSSYVNGVVGNENYPGIAFFDETRSWETLVQNGGEGVMGRLLVWHKKTEPHKGNEDDYFKGVLKFFADSAEIENLIQHQRALFWQEENKGRYISVKDIMLLLDKGGKIQIFYQGKLVTADIGLNTKFISGDKEFKSDASDFEILSAKGNVLTFVQNWKKEQVSQYFSLKVEGQSIFIESELDLKKKMPVRQQRIALRLDSDFTFFKEDKKESIKSLKHVNDLSSRIFYVGSAENKKLDLLWVPEVFDCVRMYSFFYDSSRDENELLLYLEPEFADNVYPKGRHVYYKGCINLCSKQKEKQSLFSKEQDYCSKFLNSEAKLTGDNIALKFDANSFDLYQGQMLLTKGLGIYSSYSSDNVWHDSKSALWSVSEQEKNKLVVVGVWTQIPMKQRWSFTLKNNSIRWTVEREIYDDFNCSIEQINIMLDQHYDRYNAGEMASGCFPKTFEANSGMLWDCMWSGRAASAAVSLNSKSKKYPSVKFDFKKQGNDFRAVIENTDQNYQARVLQCQKINAADGVLTAHPMQKIFEGVIDLDNE